MGKQSGHLQFARHTLYMDETLDFFRRQRIPPSKQPMLTLLKQARAYGLGVVLATQNPVDLDYKGLANTGTWLIGRLRNRSRQGAGSGWSGELAREPVKDSRAPKLDQLLSGLGKRVFLMHNVHRGHPLLFQSRWAMSFAHP